jgi:hypothetical protein
VDELKRRGIEPQTIFDVGCGDGAIGRVLRQAWADAWIEGVDVDHGRAQAAIDCAAYDLVGRYDFLALARGLPGPHLIVSNPPFRHALRFLDLALCRVRPGGHVALLLPSQWDQETNEDARGRKRERGRFLDRLRLPDGREGYGKLNYEGRVDFRGDGKTDRITYTWFVFGPGFEGVHTRIPRYAAEESTQEAMVFE